MVKEEIIHYTFDKKYSCNGAVKANPNKMTDDWELVSCKNCLRVNFDS